MSAYQLVKKIDSKVQSVNKIASYFVPYPAIGKYIQEGYKVTFIDFDKFEVVGVDKNTAISRASVELLRKLANAAHSGSKISGPGQLGKLSEGVILINPLT